jgi:hypothetical protein
MIPFRARASHVNGRVGDAEGTRVSLYYSGALDFVGLHKLLHLIVPLLLGLIGGRHGLYIVRNNIHRYGWILGYLHTYFISVSVLHPMLQFYNVGIV